MDRTNPFTRLPAARPLVNRCFPTIARRRMVAALATAFAAQFALAAPPAATALPTGGQVVAGQASIQQAGAAMTIRQATDQAILNWQSFNIGASASVNFIQPGASSVALNRVLGTDPSAIYGQLTANGQVFLVNPSGVLFGPGARVDVGGLVASTLAIRDADFLDRNYRFSRDGATAAVVNQGEIVGQYVALLAPEVRNEGVIAARMGTVALAAGDAVTLGISGQRLVDVQVDPASLDTLVENRHLIRAEEGMVVLSAQSAHTLLGRVVNSGAVEANGISTDGGTIRLLASSTVDHSGSIAADGAANASGGSAILLADLANPGSRTTVSGSITARGGSASGDGGFIETSGSKISIADSARIDAGAPRGRSGLWLLDPEDFTIALAGGDITGAALGTALASNDVTIQTGPGVNTATDFFGTAGANGDIFVNASVTWASARTLTMKAHRHINVNSEINVNGTGTLLLNYDTASGGGDYFVRAPINLAAGASFKRAVAGPGQVLAQGIARRAAQRSGNQHQLPLAGPGVLRREVDPTIGVFEATAARGGEAVVALAPELFGYQPFFLRQPINAGAHHAFVEAERLHQADEAAEPDRAAVRGDEVAVDRDDQGVGAAWMLLQEILDPLADVSTLHIFSIRRLGGLRLDPVSVAACSCRPAIVLDAYVSRMQYKVILM